LGKSFWAIVSDLVARRASACALPRPSATASAKLANTTVKNKISVMRKLKNRRSLPGTEPNKFGSIVISAVMIVPTQTTNMTGFLTITFGLSFTKASLTAL